jgi:hypothetical protein
MVQKSYLMAVRGAKSLIISAGLCGASEMEGLLGCVVLVKRKGSSMDQRKGAMPSGVTNSEQSTHANE